MITQFIARCTDSVNDDGYTYLILEGHPDNRPPGVEWLDECHVPDYVHVPPKPWIVSEEDNE